MGLVNLLDVRLPDAQAERVRANHHAAVRELQRLPAAAIRLVPNVELEDGVETPIPHGLGRPCSVFLSPPRGASSAGYIEEIRSASYERAHYVVLRASGWGATITLDLLVL